MNLNKITHTIMLIRNTQFMLFQARSLMETINGMSIGIGPMAHI